MTTSAKVREGRLLMSGPMVRATLDDRKKQTRRALDLQRGGWSVRLEGSEGRDDQAANLRQVACGCPHGQPGDRLRVLETWAVGKCADGLKPTELHPGTWLKDNGGLWYAADDAEPSHPISPRGKWRPGRFMPKYLGTWPSRITLEITNVRVDRVQSITEADCIAEGVRIPVDAETHRPLLQLTGRHAPCLYAPFKDGREAAENATKADWFRALYASLWDSLNMDRGYPWHENPWVWVIEFRRIAA